MADRLGQHFGNYRLASIQNGGVSADATTWTFHLRPGLVWSDGQPYDARDVDYTWKLWANPKFGAASMFGLNPISSTAVSADHLSITFHLNRPFVPFLADLWVDGLFAPLPAHHFSSLAPAQILKSSENLNLKVTSGPFMMAQSVPGSHYTLVRNPRSYLARDGLPYLDKIVFSVVDSINPGLKQLQAGSLDATGLFLDVPNFQAMQRLKDYTLIYPPSQNGFEALYFNFQNTVLASHPEVRQAMAVAIDHQALIKVARHGIARPLCTDHPSALHPGYEPIAFCPVFDLVAANKLLEDNGWVKGADGVRIKDEQRLEFEYSTSVTGRPERAEVQTIIQHDFGQLGIKLDIQNYSFSTFFGSLLPQGKASPPTGAVAGKYDIAEFEQNLPYDPDDSSLFACDQFPPIGFNVDFYCNPSLDALYAQEQATADSGVRPARSFAALRMTSLISLASAHWEVLSPNICHSYQKLDKWIINAIIIYMQSTSKCRCETETWEERIKTTRSSESYVAPIPIQRCYGQSSVFCVYARNLSPRNSSSAACPVTWVYTDSS